MLFVGAASAAIRPAPLPNSQKYAAPALLVGGGEKIGLSASKSTGVHGSNRPKAACLLSSQRYSAQECLRKLLGSAAASRIYASF